jgi:ribosomal-protein-alanine N-acetyltransferase
MEAPGDILTGKAIFLRSLQRDDLERTWRWMHQPDIYWAIGVDVPFSPTRQEKWFEAADQAADKLVFAICLKEAGEHIGNVSLDMIDRRHRNARLSIFLSSDSQRGKGYGSDAATIAVRYAFDFLNLHKVWCKTHANDARLARFYQQLGFEQEGVLREQEYHLGQYRDKILWGLLKRGA